MNPLTRPGLVALLVSTFGLSGLAPAPPVEAGAPPPDGDVHIIASDFTFALDRTILPSGLISFDMLNVSSELRHEVWIYPIDERDTPEFQQMLALKRAGERADELDFLHGVVAKSGEVAAGQAMVFPAAVPPGIYEVACLAREGTGSERTLHYDDGMYAVIAVRPATGTSAMAQ